MWWLVLNTKECWLKCLREGDSNVYFNLAVRLLCLLVHYFLAINKGLLLSGVISLFSLSYTCCIHTNFPFKKCVEEIALCSAILYGLFNIILFLKKSCSI